jgi:homoserine O-acetyltransferase
MLLDRLGVRSLALAIGGSLGGMLALEFASHYGTDYVRALAAIACCARHTCVKIYYAASRFRCLRRLARSFSLHDTYPPMRRLVLCLQ